MLLQKLSASLLQCVQVHRCSLDVSGDKDIQPREADCISYLTPGPFFFYLGSFLTTSCDTKSFTNIADLWASENITMHHLHLDIPMSNQSHFSEMVHMCG